MKTKLIFTAALAAMAFTSCQKDVADQGAIQPGQDTYIGMTIQLPKSVGSRTFQGDNSATKEESELTSVTVGVWSPGDVAVTYTKLDISELQNNGNATYTATKAVKAKTGTNNIIVLANTDVRPTIQQINGEAFDATVASVATDNKFVMYTNEVNVMNGVAFASKEEVEGAAVGSPLITSNRTVVLIRRAAAKVVIKTSFDPLKVQDVLGNGHITDIFWDIANQNKQMTIFSRFINGTSHIPSNVNSPFARLVNADEMIDLNINKVAYCLENAHGTGSYLENNTTAVKVRGVFAPAKNKYISKITGTSADDMTCEYGTDNMIVGQTFYVSKTTIGNIATGTYLNQDAYTAISKFGDKEMNAFTKYDKGICYWVIWINDGAAKPNYGVLRNNMYTMNITGIKAPGLPAFPDSNNPIAADTWIMVGLDVEQWGVRDMGNIEL